MTSGKDADNAALCDAVAIEHSTIYGYGIVSALSPASVNDMVVEALGQHRQRRDDVIAMLAARKVTAPVAADAVSRQTVASMMNSWPSRRSSSWTP